MNTSTMIKIKTHKKAHTHCDEESLADILLRIEDWNVQCNAMQSNQEDVQCPSLFRRYGRSNRN